MHLLVDISKVESKHATVRRLLTILSTQTWGADLSYVSALWVLLQQRRANALRADARGRKNKRGAMPPRTYSRVQVGKAKAKRVPRGGTYRAFVRLTTKGARGRPDLAKVADEYRRHTRAHDVLYQRAARLGRAASWAGRFCSRSASSFGPRTLDERRKQLGAMRNALWARTAGQDAAARALALSGVALRQGCSLGETVAFSRSCAREAGAQTRAELDAARQDVRQFQLGPAGRDQLATLTSGLPHIAMVDVHPIPAVFGDCFGVGDPDPNDAVKGAAWVGANGKRCGGVGVAVDEFWKDLHKLIVDDECTQVLGEGAGPGRGPGDDDDQCWARGVCVCSEEGLRLKRMARLLIAYVKRKCTPRSAAHAQLGRGAIVVRLSGGPKRGATMDELLADDAPFVDEWWHIGHNLWTPYGLWLMRVRRVDDLGEVPHDPRRVYVATQHEYKSLYKLLASFSRCGEVHAQLWCVEESKRHIGVFLPNTVPVVALAGASELERFWPSRVRAPRPARGPGDADAEPGADACGSESAPSEGGDAPDPLPEPAGDEVGAAGVAWGADLLLGMYEAPAAVPSAGDAAPETPPIVGDHPPDTDPDDLPPLPPPPEPPAEPAAPMLRGAAREPAARPIGRARGAATATAFVDGGHISFYASNGNFVAYCRCENHKACVLTARGQRVRASSSSERLPLVQRPLGKLVAWLGLGHVCDDKASHWADECFVFSEAELRGAREALAAAEGGAALLALERPAAPGEGP